jgi:hypothetical protein
MNIKQSTKTVFNQISDKAKKNKIATIVLGSVLTLGGGLALNETGKPDNGIFGGFFPVTSVPSNDHITNPFPERFNKDNSFCLDKQTNRAFACAVAGKLTGKCSTDAPTAAVEYCLK